MLNGCPSSAMSAVWKNPGLTTGKGGLRFEPATCREEGGLKGRMAQRAAVDILSRNAWVKHTCVHELVQSWLYAWSHGLAHQLLNMNCISMHMDERENERYTKKRGETGTEERQTRTKHTHIRTETHSHSLTHTHTHTHTHTEGKRERGGRERERERVREREREF